jgi:hypothetical protein
MKRLPGSEILGAIGVAAGGVIVRASRIIRHDVSVDQFRSLRSRWQAA